MSDVTIRPAYSKWPEYVLDADALVAALDSTFAIVERCLDLTPVVDLIPARVEIVAASDDERLGTGAVAIHHPQVEVGGTDLVDHHALLDRDRAVLAVVPGE